MLAPLNRIQVNTFLHQLPKWAQFTQERHAGLDSLENVVDFFIRGEPADTKPDTAVGALITAAQCAQYVAGFQGCRGTRTAGGQGDILESHEQGFAFNVSKRHVHAARVVRFRITVQRGVLHGEESLTQALGQALNVLSVIL